MDPLVHLELRTPDPLRDCAFFRDTFGWHAETAHVGCEAYLTLTLGERIDGGAVECELAQSLWLPYVQVVDVARVTQLAQALGASVRLEVREGPLGWRSIISGPTGAELGLWQPKYHYRDEYA